ncbi:hypothetical protein M422DRAFT_39986 [Sphaerobolus stellatus SS14]|uniref:Uncharacterized protein n=1 Tax=Sphaerobolus stellatus (strain SS14) TaxID=990650 RepID=A0A0C9UC17_SPHS4|nr:hypothetical protein M422DRAFT_39986 [Sphaerobolus stellatus SS14]
MAQHGWHRLGFIDKGVKTQSAPRRIVKNIVVREYLGLIGTYSMIYIVVIYEFFCPPQIRTLFLPTKRASPMPDIIWSFHRFY